MISFILSCSLFLISVFAVTDVETCAIQNISTWKGDIRPQDYPQPYKPNMDCYWLVQVSQGNRIELNFRDFAMDAVPIEEAGNCPNDYVAVIEGSFGSTDVIRRLCGSNQLPSNQSTIVSSSNSLLVHMHTDSVNGNRGFVAGHQGICKVTFSTVNGTIMSPNHPQNYPYGVKCEWIIDLGSGYDITLTFHKFVLETKENCEYDWVKVQEGNTADAPEKGTFCSNKLPPDIFTEGPMRIVFETDRDKEYEGFHMTWSAEDENECLDSGTCHANATCVNTPGSYQCTCMLSYTGDGKSCTWYKDFNECDLNLDNCHEDALCINTLTHFECRCKPGFLGDGLHCVDINECKNAELAYKHNCHMNASCTNTHGSFLCTCISVYTGDGVTCTDIDECRVDTHNCHADGVCINTDGSFRCECQMGYSGNGVLCSDVDECTENTDNCHNKATCANTRGSYVCTCKQGYSGDGVNCADIDECSLSLHDCHVDGHCNNTEGSYYCTCDNGYTGNGVSCTGDISQSKKLSVAEWAERLNRVCLCPTILCGVRV